MNNAHAKTLMNRLTTLAAAAALSIGATGIAHAEFDPNACETVLNEHIDWLANPPAGVNRSIKLVVSYVNYTFIDAGPEVSYLETQLNYGPLPETTVDGPVFEPAEGNSEVEVLPDGTLHGSGEALLNHHRWSGPGVCLQCDLPFDPNNTQHWNLILKAADGTLEISKDNQEPQSLPLDCQTNLPNRFAAQSANRSNIEEGYLYYGSSKYELFFVPKETTTP